MASVGMTTDTYALGMILYQIYNDGQLPPADSEETPSPSMRTMSWRRSS